MIVPAETKVPCPHCNRRLTAIGLHAHIKAVHGRGAGKPCDFPGCTAPGSRIDIKTSWFRGDDVVMNACKEHRKEAHHAALLATEKASKQL